MSLSENIIEELTILTRYNLATTQEGIKVHHTAPEATKAAIQRLFDKGLVSQNDGGYLTDLGIETAEHMQKAMIILNSK